MNVYRIAIMTVLAVAASVAAAQGPVRLEAGRATDQRIPVAVPEYVSASGLEDLGRELTEAMRYDLEFSGYFDVLPESDFPSGFDGFTSDATQINFESWRRTPAEYLVYARLVESGGELAAECRLFDVYDGIQVVGKRLSVDSRDWARQLAHRFADEIVLYLTGELGVATSQMAFTVFDGDNKEIYMADYDGHNVRRVTEHNSISIRPKMSPNGRRIAYVSYKDRYQHLYILDLDSGESAPLSRQVGLNAAPSWAPGGERLAIVLGIEGYANIYTINADGTDRRQITHERVLDTSPAWHPSGEQIAFVSERHGSPQVFVMNPDGSDARRVSFANGSAYDPSWSPNGRKLAFTVARRGEGYQLHVLDIENGNTRQVTRTGRGMNESPSWSPDSRHIVFASDRGGSSQLWTVTLDTGEERRVPNLGNRVAEGPYWGPRRHTE